MPVAPLPDAEVRVGSVLDGRYRLTGINRQGATATSYNATRLSDGHALVVKVLHIPDPTEEELARLRTEASVGARLGHPGIATPIAVLQTTEGAPFLVYEQPPGEDLGALLKRTPRLKQDAALALLSQVAHAVGAAHRVGVIHGDLRPPSIILTGEGPATKTTVIDYGIATLRHSHKPPSQSSGGTPQLVGAVSYMAPEQAHGAKPDARTDQFALAAVAFEILAGKGPFGHGSPVAILARVVHADPPPMIGVSREIEKAVLRGLAKKPADRFPTVEDFSDALLVAAGRRASPRGSSGATPTLVPDRRFPAEPWMVATKPPKDPQPAADDDLDIPARKKSPLPWIVAGGAVLAALVIGLLVGWKLQPDTPPPPAVAAPAAPPPEPAAPRDPSQIELQIEVDPPYARVRIDDKQVSPPNIRLPRGSDPVSIVVDAPDHLPTSREIVPDSDQHLVIHLTSSAAPTLARPKGAPSPPTQTPHKPARPGGSLVGSDLRDPFQ